MGRLAIRISDHVEHASTYADGEVIFNLIKPAVVAGDSVEVSFDGIHAVPSAFVNGAFVRLIEVVPVEQVRKTLSFTHTTKFINDLIRSRFNFAAHSSS